MSPLEMAAAAFMAVSVVLTIRRSLWLWPTGMIGTVLFLVVFATARLYASAGLQVFFIAMQVYGWWYWARGRRQAGEVPIRSLGLRRLAAVASATLLAAGGLALALTAWTDARAAPGDAAIAALSVTAQLLLSRKILETWLFWIAVDVVAVGIYLSQGLYWTAGLYGLFLVLASLGLREWLGVFRRQERPA
jgi:nicotinamide mononucleotide transporter